MNASISRQLILWLAIPLTLIALGGVLAHYYYVLAPQVISTDRALRDAGNALAAQLVASPARPAAVAAPDATIRYSVRDADGIVLAGDPRLPGGAVTPSADPVTATRSVGRLRLRTLDLRITTPAGVRLLTVAKDLPAGDPAARYGFMSTLLWDFVQLDVTLVLVWVGIQLGLRPLQRMRDDIAARSPLDLRPIDIQGVPRELMPLAATLNRLFGLLGAATQSQQQFIANTAHQLRTPVTGMLAQLDLLMAEPAAEALRPRLAMLKDSVRQLTHTANQLLSLARADPTANLAARRRTVDLARLAADVVGQFFDRALAAGIDLGAELLPAEISADPALLEDLLNNLVDNALRYTPAGGRVTVRSGREGGRPYLAVEDNGPGIDAADRDRVRQRFVRLPNAPGHGSGLGLAIADEIARLYGGTLTIDAGADGRGTRVGVLFADGPGNVIS